MKKLLLIAMMAVMAVTANAQKFYTGGSFMFNVSNNGDESTTTFAILPEFGYNLNEKWAVGGEIGYLKTANVMGYDEEDDPIFQQGFAFRPYARYTFAKSGIVDFFADGQIELFAPSEGDFSFGIGVCPGIAVNVSKSVALIAKTNLLSFNIQGDYKNVAFFGSTTALSFGCYFKF